ncbi:CfaE/CblD family pilus tip adhesin [Pantoea ananatis]
MILPGMKAYATHKHKVINGQYRYAFTVTVPRTKIADVVINDPVVASTHAGQTVLLPQLPDIWASFAPNSNIHESTPLSVFIGETPPAVFFPQQNTSHAVMPVIITHSGDVATGSASLDMCLYDGAGLSDSRYMLVFSDESSDIWNDMRNGGAAQGRLRYVQLPNGIQGTVPCVPSTVSVKIRPVRYSSLAAGHYTGKISILFTPST